MKKENTALRLQKIMVSRKLRQVDILELARPFCEKYDVKLNKSDLSQYVSGKIEPGQDKLFILGQALGVNEAWLMGYDVPMDHQQLLIDRAKEQLSEIVRSSPSMPSGDRLSFLFDKLDFDPEVIAFNLEIAYYHINNWLLHNDLPPRPIVDKISACVQMKPAELLNSAEFVEYSSEAEIPTPFPEGRPVYPPEYDQLSPEDKALVDNMIRSLVRAKQPDPPQEQADEDIDREVEDYRRRLILEKKQRDISSPSSEAGDETA